MKSRIRVAALAAMSALVVQGGVEAQSYRFDLGVNGGYSYFTNMLTEKHTGVTDLDVKYDAAPFVGAQGTFWFGPRLGLRANFTYAEVDIVGDDFPLSSPMGLDHMNLWSGSGDLMIRFGTPRETWTGTEVLPYLALGVGAKWQNPAGDNFTLIDNEESKTWNGHPFTTGTGTSQRTFFVSELSTLMGLAGLGADIRFRPNMALRLEAGDRMFDPQLHQATVPLTGTQYTAVASDEDVGKMVHEIYGSIGLHFLAGLSRPVEVAVIPAPAPAPTPAPTPAPPPAPTVREDAITVCVVDPTVTGGLRRADAIFLPASGDTMIVVNGTRRELRDAFGTIVVANNADWYVRGQPFTLTVTGERPVEFVSYGSARTIEPTELSFLGTVNGLPVYASRTDVSAVGTRLDELNRAQRGTDLQKFLEDADLREDFSSVKVLYVPLHSTGCVFQGVQRMEEVRKNR